jgi:iron complex outermembrane receptor protein
MNPTTQSAARFLLARRLCGFAAACTALTAFGQTAPVSTAPATTTTPSSKAEVVMEQVVVNGVRASLITAQELKMNAPEFTDSIVAQDVGKLPDNTVAEALQRVPGIQVSRGAGEAGGVVIRGLPNIETTLNGYEVFTGTARGVALQDIPAEMLAGVDAYKSVGPDKIEGGVAGLIDVRLRRPFDFKGLTFAANARGFYSDQAKKYSYNLSALASDRWKTSFGEVGALLDVSNARQKFEDQVVDNFVHFGINGETFDLATDASGVRGYYADNYGLQIRPGLRTRPAVSLMLQAKTNNGFEFYWDNLFTGYRNDFNVDFFIAIPSFGGFRDNVVLDPPGYGGFNTPEKFDTLGTPARFVRSLIAHNTNTIVSKQSFHNTTNTYQGAFGGKWEHDRVKVTGELSYSFTTVNTRSVILDTIIVSPNIAITYVDGGPSIVNLSGIDYSNPANYHMSQYFDQWSRDHSAFYAVKSDATIAVESGLLKSLQFGARYSEREVNSHSANPGSHPLPFATLASSIPALTHYSESTPFVSPQELNIRSWWTPDQGFIINNAEVFRAMGGQPLGLPAADPARTFVDKEKTFAVFGLANYKSTVGELPLDGVVGVRFTNANQALGGYQRQVINGSTTGPYVLTLADKSRWDALPMINGRLKLKDDLLFRFSWTKTMSRPGYGSVNPAVSVTSPGPTIQGSGSGGNPDLAPIQSTNYDVALEYYPSKSNRMTVAGFYRKIDGYIQSFAAQETIGGASYNITRPRSSHDGYLQGFEAGFQQFLDFLPDNFKGLGIHVNYTYIKGETTNAVTNIKNPLAQVSKHNYNAILIYERGQLSTRLAYNYRDKYIDSFNQPGIQPSTVWVQGRAQLDFSASYDFGRHFTLTIDATNLLKGKYKDNFGDLPMFSRDVRSYDRTYGVGVRYRY